MKKIIKNWKNIILVVALYFVIYSSAYESSSFLQDDFATIVFSISLTVLVIYVGKQIINTKNNINS